MSRLIARIESEYCMAIEDLLKLMYYHDKKDQYKIAEELKCAVSTVCTWFKKFGIKTFPKGTFQKSYRVSDEHKEKLRLVHKGKVVSEETRKKIAESRRGKSLIGKSERFKGVKKRKDGYLMLYTPTHPAANSQGYVMEHRLVMEKVIDRYLKDTEEVHHINKKRNDNRPENLFLFGSKAAHMYYHTMLRHGNEVELKYEY